MSGSGRIHPTNKRGRFSLWLMRFTPWLTLYITCTKIYVLEKSASATRWTPSTAHCCSSTSAMSTSQVCIPNSTSVRSQLYVAVGCLHNFSTTKFQEILLSPNILQKCIIRNLLMCTKAILDNYHSEAFVSWNLSQLVCPIFGFTDMLMQMLCERTVVSNYQATERKLLPASIRGWDQWEGWQSAAEQRVLSSLMMRRNCALWDIPPYLVSFDLPTQDLLLDVHRLEIKLYKYCMREGKRVKTQHQQKKGSNSFPVAIQGALKIYF